jgi:hypothetical protein
VDWQFILAIALGVGLGIVFAVLILTFWQHVVVLLLVVGVVIVLLGLVFLMFFGAVGGPQGFAKIVQAWQQTPAAPYMVLACMGVAAGIGYVIYVVDRKRRKK